MARMPAAAAFKPPDILQAAFDALSAAGNDPVARRRALRAVKNAVIGNKLRKLACATNPAHLNRSLSGIALCLQALTE